MTRNPRRRRRTGLLVAGGALVAALSLAGAASPAAAQPVDAAGTAGTAGTTALATTVRTAPGGPTAPQAPTGPVGPTAAPSPSGPAVSVQLSGSTGKPSTSIMIILGLTVLSVAPALLLLTTSFTKIFVVLSLTRNALGLSNVPPNQVLAGLALFLTLFIMGPVLGQVNKTGIQPYLSGQKSASVAFHDGTQPLEKFMLANTRKDDIGLLTRLSGEPAPASPASLPLTTLVPAFVLSELRAAFIIGFVIFIPFLVIDIVVSGTLMSLGMMMLPPVMISLPFKLLLFVLVDGWGLILTSLVRSYQ